MSEPVFLKRTRGLTLGEIAELTGAELPADAEAARRIVDVAPLDRAGPSHLGFYDNRRFSVAAAQTYAGACLTTQTLAADLPARATVLVVTDAYRAFVTAARALFPHSLRPSSLYEAGESVGAHVDPNARLEDGVTVEPGAVIGPHAEIGSGTLIGANAVVGAEVRIGRDCAVGAGACLHNALIGDRVIIHSGCMVGQDGFGFVLGQGGHLKVPQLGRVIIQDDVEIGAGTTIDRGGIRDTVIGEGTKIDNLVQVGHNATIGRHCTVVAQSGISGSSTIEDFVVLGARVGIGNNVTVREGAQIAARSSVHADIPAGGQWAGSPAKPIKLWLRELAALGRMGRTQPGYRPEQGK